ncbi:MAG: energy transducer TonB, partial [Burkholderiales bacterium]
HERLRRAEEERRRIEEAQRAEQLRLEEEQRRAEQERLRVAREAAEKKRQEELARQEQIKREREAKERAAAEARARQKALVDDYIARIQAKVRSRVVMPPDMSGNPEAVYQVTLLPGGDVLEANLVKSSGVQPYDAAVKRAIMAAAPLPVPPEPDLFQAYFRKINLKFRPRE